MKSISFFACVVVPAMLCASLARAESRPGVVRINDNREQRLLANPIQLVSFDDDNDTCLPPPPVTKVPQSADCAPQTAPTPPKCDTPAAACCPQQQGGACCDTKPCKTIYRPHNFDCRGRCKKCDDDDDDRCCRRDDDCKDSRKSWKRWFKWSRSNGCGCDNCNCRNGECGSGACGSGNCRNGVCGNGVYGNGTCPNGLCGNGICRCENCRCRNCPEDCNGRKYKWDMLGLFGNKNGNCDDDGHHCKLRHYGRCGHGLFGGDCYFDAYRAQCEMGYLERWRYQNHCRRNAWARTKFLKDGYGRGNYQIAYPLNPRHFDPRDGRVYSAQGWGIPMAVPVAPNVEHTYNYSWGIPASRITRMSYPGHRFPPGQGVQGQQVIVQP